MDSDGCTSQFRSQYVFWTLSFYPDSSKVFRDNGEAQHFHMMELVAALSGVFIMMPGHLKQYSEMLNTLQSMQTRN